MEVSQLVEEMNRAAACSRPFFFMLDYAGRKGHFIASPLSDKTPRILFGIGRYRNYEAPAGSGTDKAYRFFPPEYADYKSAFDKVQAGLRHGDSFLLNLTFRSRVETALTLKEIFFRSKAPYKVYLPGEFVCFSPEPFVRLGAGKISAYPMKGTIRADIPDAPRKLQEDYKEACEHATVVDLLRNDLSAVAEKVSVKRYRYMEKIPTGNGGEIWQSSSRIEGLLPADWKRRLGDIIRTLLPAGSISGAPKTATCRLISEVETSQRGWYTGICGYFDGEGLDTGVMIRCLSMDADSGLLYFYSGGGITIHSKAEEEYRELIAKIYLPI